MVVATLSKSNDLQLDKWLTLFTIMVWQVQLTEIAEREIEREEGNVMIDRAARTETEMIEIGAAVEAEKGKGIGGEIGLEIMIMIETKNMGGRGIESGADTAFEA